MRSAELAGNPLIQRTFKRLTLCLGALLVATTAHAQPSPSPTPSPSPQTAVTTPTPTSIILPANTSKITIDPRALQTGQHFTIDPVADGVLIGGGAAISGTLTVILSTGEIKASLPGSPANLTWLDRVAVTQHIDPNAGTYSTIGLGAAIAFAAVDPLLSGYRDGWDAALVDAVMYAETISLTETLTDITKIAVRRPRPIDYITCPVSAQNAASDACTNNTDLQLSFFSGHAATVGAIGATATYLAFERSAKHSPRPWITLAASLALTSFVSIERVRAGEHFPTDVIAGALAGAMIGVLVPHLHRHVQEAPTVWIGMAPAPGGGTATLSGIF